jgi:hypothetical protein
MLNPTTRHIILSVTAYVVDVCDSANQGDDTDTPVPGLGPAIHLKTRPCPTCTGLPLVAVSERSEGDRLALRACLHEVVKTLDGMMNDAVADIRAQAAAWEP